MTVALSSSPAAVMVPARQHPACVRPLIVDLDDTLVRTNTLFEAVLSIAFRQPAQLAAVLLSLRAGRAALKRRAATVAGLDCSALPYDQAVLGAIAARQSAGGEVHLVTAADQSIADGVAAALGVFDSATGSDGNINLKASRKAAYLSTRFPGGFDYIGDSAADIHIWRAAGSAIIAGDPGRLGHRLRREGLAVETLPRPAARLRTWVKALRLHQWSKNALLFVPLILAQEFSDPALTARVVIGWLLFGMVASGTYLINDLGDLAADRVHRSKRLRALPAGLIGVHVALPLAVLLLVGGIAGAFILHTGFGITVAAYTGLTLLYSFRLKQLPLVDVTAIAGLFTLRIVAGMVVIDHPVSLWLATFTMVLFLSLALAKRTAELVQAAGDERGTISPRNGRAAIHTSDARAAIHTSDARAAIHTSDARAAINTSDPCAATSQSVAPGTINGRGYLAGDAPLTLALGIATGVVSIVVMVLYMSIEAMPTGLYARNGPLLLIPVVLGLWVMRIWVLAHRGTLDDDPVVYAIRDRASWLHAAAVAGLWVLAAVR